MGNKQEGIRGIIDDLLRRIQPQDTVLLTSDHGFVELLSGDAVTISASGAEKSGQELKAVKWRYIEGFAPGEMPAAIPVTLPQGNVWMAGDGSNGRTARCPRDTPTAVSRWLNW
jgi:hypothetical protein